MNVSPLIIGNKTAKVPIVQGGMGVGVSLHGLAGAVAKEGGIGIISAACIDPGSRILKRTQRKRIFVPSEKK